MSFPLLNLNEDLCMHVFSFVADPRCLTSLSSVNHYLYQLSISNELWHSVCQRFWVQYQQKNIWANQLLNQTNYKMAYRDYLSEINFEAPVFYMRTHIQIGEVMHLNLFEPRYRLLASLLSSPGYVKSFQSQKFPRFVYLNYNINTNYLPTTRPSEPSTQFISWPAFVVDLVQCRVRQDGTASVALLPTQHCKINRMWCNNSQYHLVYADVSQRPLHEYEEENEQSNDNNQNNNSTTPNNGENNTNANNIANGNEMNDLEHIMETVNRREVLMMWLEMLSGRIAAAEEENENSSEPSEPFAVPSELSSDHPEANEPL